MKMLQFESYVENNNLGESRRLFVDQSRVASVQETVHRQDGSFVQTATIVMVDGTQHIVVDYDRKAAEKIRFEKSPFTD